MDEASGTKWWVKLTVMVVASLVCCLYFQELMLAPNRTAPTFGGDGLTIHYNLQWHATYGAGVYLNNQYHPYEESIFMTDAHSLVAVILAGLRPIFPDIGAYAVGIANVLIFWSNPLAIFFLFLCLRRLGVRWPLALVFATLIGLMSPQILRQMGQYTLGFTFLLPAICWYLLSFSDQKHYWLKSLGIGAMIYLLGLNNPYLYAIATSLLLAAAGVGVVLRLRREPFLSWARIGHWLAVALLTTTAVFATLKSVDHVEDRVAVPFGFFHNTASWGGLLTSKATFPYRTVRSLAPGLSEPRRENRAYLGLVPLLVGIALPLILLIPRWRRRSGLEEKPILLLLVGAGCLGLIFAFGLPFSRFEYWTYEHLGSILQFRAPVRFSWPLYYASGLLAAYVLSTYYQQHPRSKVALALLALGILAWSVETHQYLRAGINVGPSAFWPPHLTAYTDIADREQLNAENYSSIYLLPTEQGWTDKIHREGAWKSNHDGYKMSLVTGLPLLNGKLSRVSLRTALASLQLSSHPLIAKPLLSRIDTTKDILLLNSIKDSLTREEKRLWRLGVPVHKNDQIALRRLSPTALLAAHRTRVRAAKADTGLTKNYLRIPLEGDARHAFVGQGSRYVERGWTQLFHLPADTLSGDGPYELSLWNYVDGSRFGGPKCYLRLLDAEGKRLAEHYAWTNETFDYQHGWLRVAIPFDLLPGTAHLELVTEYNFPYWIDEILVRPAAQNVRYQDMYNNYRLE